MTRVRQKDTARTDAPVLADRHPQVGAASVRARCLALDAPRAVGRLAESGVQPPERRLSRVGQDVELHGPVPDDDTERGGVAAVVDEVHRGRELEPVAVGVAVARQHALDDPGQFRLGRPVVGREPEHRAALVLHATAPRVGPLGVARDVEPRRVVGHAPSYAAITYQTPSRVTAR